jgi:hypothetical protein
MSAPRNGEGATVDRSVEGESTSFSGGCACGAIRYACSTEPILSFNCHCRTCQRANGSAFASVLVVTKVAFELLQGEPKYYSTKTDSGYAVQRGFCPECGSQVFIMEPHRPDIVVLHAGSLDDPSWHKPVVDIYTASAYPWDHMDPALPKFPEMPPLPDSPLFKAQPA